MRIRKFEAADMREALAMIRRELGPEAMVVATRKIRRGLGSGIEVTAAIDEQEASHTGGPTTYGMTGAPARAATATTSISSPSPVGGLSESDVEKIIAPLRSELRSLRVQVRASADTGSHDELRGELAALRQSLAGLRGGTLGGFGGEAPLAELAGKHTLVAPSEKRVVAVVGPTGVGKTTTLAKLAARAALIERRQVHILSLDSYRVGGEEQIRTYADLIGVPLTLVQKPAQLEQALRLAGRAERVFIDTAGRSPRDTGALAELGAALGNVGDLEVHLAMPAGLSAAAIDTCAKRYACCGIDRLLFTKLDEAEELAQLVRAPARVGRPVTWLTTGQRVPEDLELATGERLLALAQGGFDAATTSTLSATEIAA